MVCLMAVFWIGQASAENGQCKVPLFLQQNGAKANVLFILDSSGSMTSVIYHDDYDGTVTYSGRFKSTTVYGVSSARYYTPQDFNWSWESSPSAYLVPSEKGQDSRYMGNYLNWIFYNATDVQRASLPAITRIEVAKAVMSSIISDNTSLRFGIMKLRGDDGGEVVSPVGAEESVLLNDLESIVADGWTPLAESMVDALYYFQTSGLGAPIQYDCQENFIVLLTDGYPTQDLDVPAFIGDYDGDGKDPGTCESIGAEEPNSSKCSDYLDDVVAYLNDIDLRPDLQDIQNVVTYTIGFGVDMLLLQEAAFNGEGLYFTADNAIELRSAFTQIFGDIEAQLSSGSSVSVISSEHSSNNRLFRATFMPGAWWGFLEAHHLPYQENAYPIWEAGAVLSNRDPSTRIIFTSIDGQMVDFNQYNLDLLLPYLNTASADTAGDIIEYIRGTDIDGYRERAGRILGDIIGSSPTVVGAPSEFRLYLNYADFKANYSDREEVLYVGANDGMLHCFRASDGYELWAYIPQSNLGKLRKLMAPDYCHDYFMDASPKISDVYVDGQWKTALLCGQGEGGDRYLAMDITNPSYPYLMWEVSLPMINESPTSLSVARIQSLNKFVAFVGSGPDRSNGEAHLVALDMSDGSILWSDLLSVSADINKTTAPVVVDIDYDDYDDLLYVSDLAGHFWRVDLRENTWSKSMLFQTDQPIQSKPVLTVDEQSNVLAYFGTGQYLAPDDVFDTSQQTFYCIIDNHSENCVSRYDLVDQTSTISEISDNARGWFIDLVQTPGERMIRPDALAAGVVYFTTFAPTAALCASGGRSYLYTVDFLDGSAPDTEEGVEDDTTENRVEEFHEGIGSDPIVDFANEQIIIQFSDTKLMPIDAKIAFQRLIVRSWRPLYDQ